MTDNRATFCHAVCNGIRKINTADKCFDFCIKWCSSNDYLYKVSTEYLHCLLAYQLFYFVTDNGDMKQELA